MLYDKHGLTINWDEYAENPRNYDNWSKMYCGHRNYALGDKDVELLNFAEYILGKMLIDDALVNLAKNRGYIEDYQEDGWYGASGYPQETAEDALEDYITMSDDIGFLFELASIAKIPFRPLYLYDHSGLSISTGEFSCKWDSGLLGVAWVEDYIGEYDYALALIEEEVKLYDKYLSGESIKISYISEEEELCLIEEGSIYDVETVFDLLRWSEAPQELIDDVKKELAWLL